MSTIAKAPWVETHRVRALLVAWLGCREHGALTELSLRTGVGCRVLYRIASGHVGKGETGELTSLRLLDRILVGIGRPDLAQLDPPDGFADVYDELGRALAP